MAKKTKKKKFEKKDPYEVITNKVIELMKKGTVPWKKTWKGSTGLPANLVEFRKTGKTYSGLNIFTTLSLGYSSRFFLTWNQIQELGGKVKAGEKSFPVIFWKFIRRDKKDSNGNVITKKGKTIQETFPMLRYWPVWNTDQLTGIDIPELDVKNEQIFNPIKSAEKIVKGYIGKPDIQHGGDRASYSPTVDIINMPPKKAFDNEESYYSTLFHEMTHSTGHKNRLDREEINNFHYFGDENYSKEELTAELGATFLNSEAGIATDATMENSVAYLQGWIKKLQDDKTLIVRASTLAKKAVNLILGIKETEYDSTEKKDENKLALVA